ncbi:hypothetical protein BH11PLA2_BH11PLA2_20150 [soil metagenome]
MQSHRCLLVAVILTSPLVAAPPSARVGETVIVYEDAKFYSSFPSVVRRDDGELLLAFRRAPDRRPFGEAITHTDPNSNLVSVRSRDNGKTWDAPQLMFAHPFGGSQDPCMVQLKNGTILCTSYGWALLKPDAIAKLRPPVSRHDPFVSLGGYLLRSKDGGKSWQGPIAPASVPGSGTLDIFGQPLPSLNRGAMAEGRDGTLRWVVASHPGDTKRTATHLLVSADQGDTWKHSCVVAEDPKIDFNEASIFETPKGDWVAFLRTQNHDDQTVLARSTDGGKSFQWADAGFRGHPHQALRLPDNHVLLVYGYRHKPFGIRARILNAECTDTATAPELVLRDDGGTGDLGYPWATLVDKDRALVCYYFNKANGTRHIASTWVHFQ